MADFGYSMTDALNEDMARSFALLAVCCERNGMVGKDTYRAREMLIWLSENKDISKSDNTFVFV